MSVKLIKAVYDTENNKLLDLPCSSLLDNIIGDLWNVIIKYSNYPLFIICNTYQSIPFYRCIGKDEFDVIKYKLRNYHDKNKGIPLFPNYVCPINSYVGIDKDNILTNGLYYFKGHINDFKLQMLKDGCLVDNDTYIRLSINHSRGRYSRIMIYDPNCS